MTLSKPTDRNPRPNSGPSIADGLRNVAIGLVVIALVASMMDAAEIIPEACRIAAIVFSIGAVIFAYREGRPRAAIVPGAIAVIYTLGTLGSIL